MKNPFLIIVFILALIGSVVGAVNSNHRDSVIADCRKEIASLKAQLAAPKPAIKESTADLQSSMDGNISLFSIKKSGDQAPQFRKLSHFIKAIRSFSRASGFDILSVTPAGEYVMIDGEPAYQTIVVTHTKPFAYQ
jgi:hypothetical protein